CTPVVDSWLIALHRDIPPKACPPAPTGTVPVDLCGTVSTCPSDPTLQVFQPNGSAFFYELVGSIAPFGLNAKLRLCGHIVPNTPRSCPGTIDLIVVDAVSECETKHSRPSRLVAQWVFPNDVVTRVQTGKAGWDGHRIFSYTVDLPDGCLQHNFFREGEYDPATGVFFPRRKLTYWISIQAAIGHTVVRDPATGECTEMNTGRTVDQEFWGWHTTPHGYQHKDDAYMGRLSMSCEDPMRWKYDWMGPLHCSDPLFHDCCDDPTKSIDMAFYLIRTQRVCLGGLVAGQPCTVDADCKVDGTTGATCFAREEIKWCQPVNPLRATPVPTPIPTPGGLDEFPDTSVEVEINIPGRFSGTMVLTGPTVISRTNLGVEEPDFGAVAGDAFQDVSLDDLGRHRSRARKVNPVNRSLIREVFAANTTRTIQTEILSMDLRGFDPGLGFLRLLVSNIGSSGQDGVRRQSTGVITGFGHVGFNPQPEPPAFAVFDVFFEIEVDISAAGGNFEFVSDGPLRLEAQIFEIPPTEIWFKSVEGTSVGLLDRDTLEPIPDARIKSVTHCVPTKPKGGVNIHSDVDWKTAPTVDCCEPDDSTATGCTPAVCPSADLECVATASTIDLNGVVIITACDCVQISPAGCRWEDLGAGVVDCVGDCPDGTACEITTVVNADGTVDTNCGCDKIEKQACCLFDGTCIEVTTEDECCTLGGTWQGPGTDCLNTICPLPLPIVAGANWDIHMDIPGELANDFHIEGIVKSECPPVLVTHIDDLFPNFTHTFNPLGGGHYEFQADWSGVDYQFCDILHLGLLFEVCCKNVMIDLVGWWTFDGVRITGAVAAASNDGYWPFIGFDVQDCIPPPPEPPVCEQQVRLRNDSDRGRSIPVEIVSMQLVSVDPASAPPFSELCDTKIDPGTGEPVPCAQHDLKWINVLDPAGNIITDINPVQMAAGDEIMVLLRPAPGTTADITHTVASLIDLKPAEFLLVRGLMRFIGNGGNPVAGGPVGEELRWFFDIHGAHHLPEPEACCFEDGTCLELIAQECLCEGGTPLGLGTLCDTDGDGVDDACDQVCEPTADKTSCTKVECPDLATDPKLCQTKCVVFDPVTGTSEVSECDCIGFDDCHVKVPPAGSTGGVAGPGGNPCVVPDNGGTVELPPQGCEYLSPEEVHEILGGLPAGTTIEFAAIHKDFICGERNLGGDCPPPGICEDLAAGVDCFESVVEFNLVGTGDLDNLIKRTLSIPVLCEVHTGPRVPGDTVQSFDTEMVQLQGELFGDPDFCTLKIVAGSAFGLPSPGHTTLTQLPSGDWNVDSFFDMTYRIDFEGCDGTKLEGMSGSTTGRIRMQTGNHPECEGSCAADEICVQTQVVNSDGTIEICCDCQPAPVCEPTTDGLGCEDTLCPSANEQCVPQKVTCEGGTCRVIECKCQDPDVCHIELVQQQGTTKVSCTGGCPPKRYCARLPIDTDNNGSKDGFECVCRGKPKAILVPAGPKGASRAFGIEHEDIGVVAGAPSEEVVKEAIRVKLVQLYDEGVCPPRTTQPNLSLFDGEYRWFGPPAAFADNSLFAPKFVASELRCNATFRDWSEAAVSLDFPGANASVVHGYGAAVVPCSTFEVQIVEEYCADLSDESCYSEAVQFTTGLWGDLWAEFGLINFTDIGKVVDAFKGIPYDEGPPEDGAPPEVRAMLRGNVPPYSSRINFTDIGKVVDAFKTIAYGEFGPGEEICDDGIDNDCDGTIDADGSTCVGCGAGANCECSAGSCEDP
ncbi:MAG: hypothetical protein IIC01_01415, partial [Planctomycetes bacterium]|nr:hypothetical protein [Planctomycetota bacterium]